MSLAGPLRQIARPLDDPDAVGRAVDALLAVRPEPPSVLALGEPVHGIAAFPLLRNELLVLLVERGFRSVVLETDFFAAAAVEDYCAGVGTDLETVLATGFSHGFGAVPGNRELVEWLRAHNAERPPGDRVRFYGFDAPVEFAGAPSPRLALSEVADHLPAPLRPESAAFIDELVGDEADWTNPAAMYDSERSIGGSDRARALRLVADDLASAFHRAAPGLRTVHPARHHRVEAHARTAVGLLRYHAAMAQPATDRIGRLLSVRAAMMAANLLDIVAAERHRGPTLVFAHNAHLSPLPPHPEEVTWANAGSLVHHSIRSGYAFVAADAARDPGPQTLQGLLAAATGQRALFGAAALQSYLPQDLDAAAPLVPGHQPLTPADLNGADAVIYLADIDSRQHRYW